MNRFEILPEELQNKIYYETHKLKFKDVLKEVKEFKSKRIVYNDDFYLIMIGTLYDSEMSQKEREEYFTAMDCFEGKLEYDLCHDDLNENKYYNIFITYWVYEEEQDYYSTPVSRYIYGR
jgi:hypothetical protein